MSKEGKRPLTRHRMRVAACLAVGVFLLGLAVGSQSYDAGALLFRLLEFPLWKTHLRPPVEAPWLLKGYLENLTVVVSRLACGAIGLGIQPVLGLCADGFQLGSYWKFASEAGVSPGWLTAWSVLPHGLVEYPVALYAAMVSLNATLDVLDWRQSERLWVRIRRQAVQCTRAALIAAPLLFVAAYLEWGGPRDHCQRLLLPQLGLPSARLERRTPPTLRALPAAGAGRRYHVGGWLFQAPGEYQLWQQNRIFRDRSSIFRGARQSGRSLVFTDFTPMYGPLHPEVQFLASMRIDAASSEWKVRDDGVTYSSNPLIRHQYVAERTTGRRRFSKTHVLLRQGDRVASVTFICPVDDKEGPVQHLNQILNSVRLSTAR